MGEEADRLAVNREERTRAEWLGAQAVRREDLSRQAERAPCRVQRMAFAVELDSALPQPWFALRASRRVRRIRGSVQFISGRASELG